MSGIQRYITFCPDHDGEQSRSAEIERSDNGTLVIYNDHLRDKAATIAALTTELQALATVAQSFIDAYCEEEPEPNHHQQVATAALAVMSVLERIKGMEKP